jgi:hypothetical protein
VRHTPRFCIRTHYIISLSSRYVNGAGSPVSVKQK